MTDYNFNLEIDRHNTNSLKHDFVAEKGKPADVLPMWIADMDLRTAQPILDALHKAVEHGIFGYSEVKDEYYQAVAAWFKKHFGWETKSEWLVKTPGIVYALVTAVKAMTNEGDNVIILTPVYYPFYSVVRKNNRNLVESELKYVDGHYEIDFDDFEAKIRENNVKMFISCSPHNPIGRVWTKDELRKIGEICEKYGVFVVSDEIHCDFALPNHPHSVFAEACPNMAERCVVCTAPSKTFNIAGLQVSNIWIPNEDCRNKFIDEMDKDGYSLLNTLGLVAAQAAYEGGEEWLDECKAYLLENLNFVREFLRDRVPEIKLVEPEGTYFAWLDCSALGLDKDALEDFMTNKAKLWLDAGYIFGEKGSEFQRVVLACPRKTLEEAMLRLEKAVKEL